MPANVRFFVVGILVAAVLLVSCQPSSGGDASRPRGAGESPTTSSGKTLVMLIRLEPASLASKALQQAGTILTSTRRVFNATLGLADDRGAIQPYLARELPALNTASWQVFADGRMETTYHLRPNLTWHDGAPLDADDFVFAQRVYSASDLGLAGSPPQSLIEEVTAPDPTTVTIRWSQSFADAGTLTETFPPLPRHLLEETFDQRAGGEAFTADPYWTRGYVGLGPYRLDRWEPGAFIDASAFDGHALGRPKIGRITIKWSADPNASLATILAGDVQLSVDSSLQFEQGLLLKQQWATQNGGSVVFKPDLFRGTAAQLRPELSSPRAILDPRVRKAIALAMDKRTLNEALFHGEGFMADGIIPTTVWYGADLDRGVVKYPYDLKRSEELMAEAGFTKGADGTYTSPTDGRFAPEVKTNASAFFENEMSTLASGWRSAGFDFSEAVNPAALVQDAQVRALFPSFFTFSQGLGEQALVDYSTQGIPRPENRYVGSNRGGWSNPDFDALAAAVNATLERDARAKTFIEMSRVLTEDLPILPLYFQPSVNGFAEGLTGPGPVAQDTAIDWNLHQWELR